MNIVFSVQQGQMFIYIYRSKIFSCSCMFDCAYFEISILGMREFFKVFLDSCFLANIKYLTSILMSHNFLHCSF